MLIAARLGALCRRIDLVTKHGQQAVAVATSRLHNIAGNYTGKDDPVMLVRVQMDFPATGEVLAPFAIGHFVAGGMRGSHHMPLMPVQQNSSVSYFDGPPVVSCAGFCEHRGKLTEPVDCFVQPFWDEVRRKVANKALDMRRQGFVGAAMLPMDELDVHRHRDETCCARKTFRDSNADKHTDAGVSPSLSLSPCRRSSIESWGGCRCAAGRAQSWNVGAGHHGDARIQEEAASHERDNGGSGFAVAPEREPRTGDSASRLRRRRLTSVMNWARRGCLTTALPFHSL